MAHALSTSLLQKVFGSAALLGGLALAGPVQGQVISGLSRNLVSAGDVIVISGTGLGSVSQVLLDGQPMVKSNLSGGTLSVTVPLGASSGYLRLISTSNNMVLHPLRIRVMRSSSSAMAVETTSITMPTMGSFNTPWATDLDGDGKTDLLVGDNRGRVGNYEQQNSGAFPASPAMLRSDGQTLDVQDFAKPTVTDLDGDGKLDLLVGTGNGHRIVRYEQLGGNSQPTEFGPGTNLTLDGTNPITTNSDYPRPTATDLDGNGLIDLLVGDDSGRIAFYEQRAATGAQAIQFVLRQASLQTSTGATIDVGNTSKPVVVDWDGNGLLDLLVGSSDGKVYRYEQSRANSVSFVSIGLMQSAANTSIDSGSYAAPTVTDLDGDGRMDLILGNDSGTLRRFEQGVATPVTPLPVVLVAFDGSARTGGNQLSWATAQEVNSARFVVEYSATGERFAPLNAVEAAGNSTSLTTYVYLDASPAALSSAISYYRLRQEDLDGTVHYSPVLTVRRAGIHEEVRFAAFPNPYREQLEVALPGLSTAQATTVQLSTAAGRLVYEKTLELGAAPQALPGLPELPTGVYLLRLQNADGVAVQKIVRQ